MEIQVELSTGIIVDVRDVVIDTDGTNLADGIEIHSDDELVGDIVGYSTSSENLSEIIEQNLDIY